MNYFQSKYPIVDKKMLTNTCVSFTIKCDDVSKIAVSGQFVHVKVAGFSLRRPISICQISNDTIRIVFDIRGEGTKQLSTLQTGDLIDIIAPLGNGFKLLDSDKKAVLIGGGIGVPPMLNLANYYKDNSTAIIGFRNKNSVILEDDFINANAKTLVYTDDGSYENKGHVGIGVTNLLENEKPDIIYACGPHVMLKAVVELSQKYNIPCQVSLEERMGCGVGACLVCACRAVKDGTEYFAHVCKDGPVFDSNEVIL